MKVLSLFSGIGAFEKAAHNLGIDVDLVNYCDIDKCASNSYSAVFGVDESKNLGDITKVDEKKLPKDIDLITYGFCCQDISVAGKQKGLFDENGDKTRSGLFFDALRIIKETQPKVAIAENVKALTSEKFNQQFKLIIESLIDAGYNNYFDILNGTEFGIPQHRERIFIVSIRKDLDDGSFRFPVGKPLTKFFEDMLEDKVDEKYYLSPEHLQRISKWKAQQDPLKDINLPKKIAPTLTARGAGEEHSGMILINESLMKGKYSCATRGRDPQNPSNRKKGANLEQRLEVRNDGLSNTLTTVSKDNYVLEVNCVDNLQENSYNYCNDENIVEQEEQPKDLKRQLCENLAQSGLLKHGDVINHSYTNGLNGKNPNSRLTLEDFIERQDNISPTLTTRPDTLGIAVSDDPLHNPNIRIRKPTPLECWRLMGFDDEDYYKAEKVNTAAQLYKQAGNAIIVNVAQALLKSVIASVNIDPKHDEFKEQIRKEVRFMKKELI